MIIDAGAAPACGARGTAKVAAKSAAVETIQAGFDHYIITGGSAQSNITTTQMPGNFNTVGTNPYYGGGYRTYNATTIYPPGSTIVSGSHERQLGAVMFKKGDPGYESGLDTREMLGAEWADLVKSGVNPCL